MTPTSAVTLTAAEDIIITIFAVLTLLAVIWLWLSATHHHRAFELDPDGQRYSFYAILACYRWQCWLLTAISVPLAVAAALHGVLFAAVALVGAATYAMVLPVWLAWCYEGYLHHRYVTNGSSSYTGGMYALTIALAISAVACFVGGWLGLIMALLGIARGQ
jgi:hypothetical protein